MENRKLNNSFITTFTGMMKSNYSDLVIENTDNTSIDNNIFKIPSKKIKI